MSGDYVKQVENAIARFISNVDSTIAVPLDVQYNSAGISYSQQVMASAPVVKDTTTEWKDMKRYDDKGNSPEGNWFTDLAKELQLEEGDKATLYEPYREGNRKAITNRPVRDLKPAKRILPVR